MAASGGGHGAFRGKFDFVAGDLFRNPDGTFNTFQHEAATANRQLADKLQKQVAQALRQSLRRPAVSTGILEQVTREAHNRYSDQFGFGVGIINFLDKSPAKYWEQIEEGSEVHVGQRLRGVWVNAIRYVGSDYQRGDPYSQRAPVGRPSEFGAGGGQAFIPIGAREARKALRNRKARRPPRVSGVIRNPIKPEWYYRRGWEEFNVIPTLEREYDAVFRRIGFKVKWVNGRLTKAPLRGAQAAGRRQARGADGL